MITPSEEKLFNIPFFEVKVDTSDKICHKLKNMNAVFNEMNKEKE
jgi:hypothetical protein